MGKKNIRGILYFLDIFPAISETFIINEILELERKGLTIFIATRKKEKNVMHGVINNIRAPVVHLPKAHSLKITNLVIAHVKMMFLHPFNYIKTIIFALKGRSKALFWFFKISCVYADIVKQWKFSHIHSHFASVASCYAMFISKILGLPYTFTVHGWHDLFEYPPADLKERALQAKKVVTVSQYNKKYMREKYFIPNRKMEVIHCGVNIELFNKIKREKKEKIVKILSVTRLHPIKGVEYLLSACEKLKQKKIPFKCSIIGEGEEKERLSTQSEKMGLTELVNFEGSKATEEVRKIYSLFDIYVQPSICEGLPLSVMEAMASELPVVATNVTGMSELVRDGATGYLVEPKNPLALCRAIEKLIKDSVMRESMGMAGRKKIEKEFDLKRETSKLINMWVNNES